MFVKWYNNIMKVAEGGRLSFRIVNVCWRKLSAKRVTRVAYHGRSTDWLKYSNQSHGVGRYLPIHTLLHNIIDKAHRCHVRSLLTFSHTTRNMHCIIFIFLNLWWIVFFYVWFRNRHSLVELVRGIGDNLA